MKTSLIEPKWPESKKINGWDYGYVIYKDRLTQEDVDWLRQNIAQSEWFYTWDAGVINRILCFKSYEDLLLFKVACGS